MYNSVMRNNNVIRPSDSPDSIAGSAHRKKQKEAARVSLLEAASRLVAEGGTEALSLRKVADEVGASTMVVYTAFGSKEGLLDALWVEGFRRLWELEASALKLKDPLARLKALGQAYRRNALNNPYFYKLVFGGQLPKSVRANASGDADDARTFEVLIAAVVACQSAGLIDKAQPASDVAALLWSSAHGAISLELTGMLGRWADPQKIYDQNFDCLLRGLK